MTTSLLRRAVLLLVPARNDMVERVRGISVIFPEILKQYVIASGIFEVGSVAKQTRRIVYVRE